MTDKKAAPTDALVNISDEKLTRSLQEHVAAARESMHARFFEAFDKANEAFAPDSLAADISAMLTKERREIVLKLLGFNNQWGTLEVDHCNGRDATSIVGAYLRKEAEVIVSKWLRDEIQPIFEAKARERLADSKVRNAVVKDFTRLFNLYINDYMNAEAKKLARAHVQALSEQVSKAMSLGSEE